MNATLLDSTVRNQIYLEGLKAGQVKRFSKFLKEIDRDIRERLTREDLTSFSRTRLERLLVSVNKNINDTMTRFHDEFEADLVDLAEYESGFEARSLENTIDQDGFEAVIPSPNQVKAAVFSTPLSVTGADGGKLLTPFIKDWSARDRGEIVGVIRKGFFEGKTNFQIIQEIRGTKSRNFQDGVIGKLGRNLEALVRTSVQHVASVSRFETWKQNPEVVKGYEWVSTLDSKTSTVCKGLDGRRFVLGKGPRPPAHIRCRSTTVAVLDPKYDFLKDGETRAARGPDGRTVQVQDKEYYEWLKTQPAEFQDDALGPIRAKLFRDGGLSVERFKQLQLNKQFQPLTLEEMRKKEPRAFLKAFGQGDKVPTRVKTRPSVTTSDEWQDSKAGTWSRFSFSSSRKEAKAVALANQDISVLRVSGSAYADHGRQINMAKYAPESKNGQNVWRHEFGHIIDFRRGGSYWGYASSRDEYVDAMKSDAENLKIVAGIGRAKRKIQNYARLKADSAQAIQKGLESADKKGREAFNRSLAVKAGLDYDQLVDMLDQTTGQSDFTNLGSSYRLANIIESVRLQDAETFYNNVSLRNIDYSLYASTMRIDGWYRSFSDLVGAATRNKVNSYHRGYPGHTDSYYARLPLFAPTETFANLTALYGHPHPYVWELTKRFVPNLINIYLEIFNDQ